MKDPNHSNVTELNWLMRWQAMYTAEREQAEQVTDANFAQHADCWSTRAQRFAELSLYDPQPDAFMQQLLPNVHAHDTVLDVGAGTGRYVSLLARHVARVIALEPSAAMRMYLEKRVAEERLDNVEILADAWPSPALPSVDVVISAHVLYAVDQIGPFLQAMDVAATRACYLYLMIQHHNLLFSPFWKRFHGQARLPLPCALEAFNVLYQLGIPASFTPVPAGRRFHFADKDEALSEIRQRLRFEPDAQRDQAIMTAIDEILIHNPDGSLALPNQYGQSAVIWWKSATARNVSA